MRWRPLALPRVLVSFQVFVIKWEKQIASVDVVGVEGVAHHLISVNLVIENE